MRYKKIYECYVCAKELDSKSMLNWQINDKVHLGVREKIGFNSKRGTWCGMFVRCPKHRIDNATFTTLGELLTSKGVVL